MSVSWKLEGLSGLKAMYLGRWKGHRIKKEANMESKVGKMKLFIVIISRASFSPVVKDSLSYVVISGLF